MEREPSHPDIAKLVQADEIEGILQRAREHAAMLAFKRRLKRRRRKLGWNGFTHHTLAKSVKKHAFYPSRNST